MSYLLWQGGICDRLRYLILRILLRRSYFLDQALLSLNLAKSCTNGDAQAGYLSVPDCVLCEPGLELGSVLRVRKTRARAVASATMALADEMNGRVIFNMLLCNKVTLFVPRYGVKRHWSCDGSVPGTVGHRLAGNAGALVGLGQ